MRRLLAISAAAVLAAGITAGCASAAPPRPAAAAKSSAPLPGLSSLQARQMCAGLKTGTAVGDPEHQYRVEVAIAWNELQNVTGPQANRAVITAAARYCPQFRLSMLPPSELTPGAFAQP